MSYLKTKFSALAIVVHIPLKAFAAGPYFGRVDGFFSSINGFINGVLVPFIFTIALLVFIYGMFNYFIIGGANETKREEGKKMVTWSIIGFVLMVSIWGIVNLIAGDLFEVNTPPTLPGTPTL